MTLNISVCTPQLRAYQNSIGPSSRPQYRRHRCRHPPPSARPNPFVRRDFEQMSEGLIPALWSGLLKIGSVWPDITPARLALGRAARDTLLPFQSALLVS